MGELGVNKIMGALLATALGLMALHSLSGVVFSHGESIALTIFITPSAVRPSPQ